MEIGLVWFVVVFLVAEGCCYIMGISVVFLSALGVSILWLSEFCLSVLQL